MCKLVALIAGSFLAKADVGGVRYVQMAQLRRAWRQEQGAVDVRMMECEVHVRGPDSVDPEVYLQGSNSHESPARSLVSELMILANQAVATFGEALKDADSWVTKHGS